MATSIWEVADLQIGETHSSDFPVLDALFPPVFNSLLNRLSIKIHDKHFSLYFIFQATEYAITKYILKICKLYVNICKNIEKYLEYA